MRYSLSFCLLLSTLFLVISPFSYSQGEYDAAPISVENPEATQNNPDNICSPELNRPCVALVLGGGGARGGAHIGVLKALEERGVPIDIIVGTSIGSFVGALYSSGKSADDIKTLFATADWNSGYQDNLNRDEIPNRRKRQLDSFPIHLDLGVDSSGIKLPRGFLQGQGLKGLIDELLGQHTIYLSFNDMPIPFRAVAGDVETGEEVVLGDGDLATAVQISMSLPGILRPIEKDNRILVDGGIANNLPVSVAKSLGADIVIAVNIGSPPLDKSDLSSGVAILRQMTSLLTRKNVEYQRSLLTNSDIYIEPNIDGVSLLSFDTVMDAIEPGYEATQAAFAESESLQSVANQRPPRNSDNLFFSSDQKIFIDNITLTNESRLGDDYILHRMQLEPQSSYSLEEIKTGIDRLYGQGTISRINTSIETKDDLNSLDIDVQEKEWGPGYLDLKFTFEDDFDSFSRYQIGASYRLTNLSPYGAEWYTTGEFGTEKKFYTELYWPIRNSGYFWDVSASHSRTVYEFLIEGEPIGSVVANDNVGRAGIGWNSVDRFDAFLGFITGTGDTEVPFVLSEILDNITDIEYKQSGMVFNINYDTLDNANFPSRGWKVTAQFANTNDEYVDFFSDTAKKIDIELNGVLSFGRHSFRQLIRYQSTVSDDPSSFVGTYTLGGFLNLSGNIKNSIVGRQVRFLSTIYTYELAANNFGALNLPLYLGLSAETGNAWNNREAVDYHDRIGSGSAFIGWDSPLGPAYLAYGKSDTGQKSLYVFLGIVF